MEEEPKDRNRYDVNSQVSCPEKKEGIARVPQGKKDDDEEEIFEFPVPGIPTELEAGSSRNPFSYYIGDPSKKNPDTEECRNDGEDKYRPEIQGQGGKEKCGDERSYHGSGMVHGPLKTECLSPLLSVAGLREQCISRRSPYALANPVKKPEKENVVSRGGQPHKWSGYGGEGISEEDDPLPPLKSVGKPT